MRIRALPRCGSCSISRIIGYASFNIHVEREHQSFAQRSSVEPSAQSTRDLGDRPEMGSRLSRCVWLAILVWVGIAAPKPALAIPVFANGQGVSCQQCHSAPPNLNAYGRYILATNFSKVLDAHAQELENQRDPVSLIVTGTGSNTPDPTLPKVVA